MPRVRKPTRQIEQLAPPGACAVHGIGGFHQLPAHFDPVARITRQRRFLLAPEASQGLGGGSLLGRPVGGALSCVALLLRYRLRRLPLGLRPDPNLPFRLDPRGPLALSGRLRVTLAVLSLQARQFLLLLPCPRLPSRAVPLPGFGFGQSGCS